MEYTHIPNLIPAKIKEKIRTNMTLKKILNNGYNGYDYNEFKEIVEFLKELKKPILIKKIMKELQTHSPFYFQTKDI